MIIQSLLDTDFYKLMQQQFVFHQFPKTEVTYEFKCRNNIELSFLKYKIIKEINDLCSIKFKKDEIQYLRETYFFKEDFLDYLKNFQLNPKQINIGKNPLSLVITGLWVETILFETPILAIISQLYKPKTRDGLIEFKGHTNLFNKIQLIKDENIHFADFGTRRRYNRCWHDIVIKELKNMISDQFIGTSNIYFARKYDLDLIGTIAHEILQAGQALAPSLQESQTFILEKWLDEYKRKLSIALTDVINMDCFLRDFNINLTHKYQGCRQDSGDPFTWGEKLISHYQKLNIDPKQKYAVFSDGLTFPLMIKINNHFKDRIKCLFGIGTNLTNDVGINPLQIVIKMTKCNGKPVAKISDTPGKGMCEDSNHLKKLREVFGL